MKIIEVFPGNYLKADGLQGRSVKAVIAGCSLEDLGSEKKPLLHFEGRQKGLVMNKTNSNVIASAYGDDTNGWVGQTIELYPAKAAFKGEIVDAIRVRVPAPPGKEGPVNNFSEW